LTACERILSHIGQQDGNITLVQRVTPDCGVAYRGSVPPSSQVAARTRVVKEIKNRRCFSPEIFSAGFQVIPEI